MVSKAFEMAKMAAGVTADSTGAVTAIDMTTDVIQQGTTNLFEQGGEGGGGLSESQIRSIASGQAIALGG